MEKTNQAKANSANSSPENPALPESKSQGDTARVIQESFEPVSRFDLCVWQQSAFAKSIAEGHDSPEHIKRALMSLKAVLAAETARLSGQPTPIP